MLRSLGIVAMSKRRCRWGTIGSAASGLIAGYAAGLPAVNEIGAFAAWARLLIAGGFGVAGSIAGGLIGVAQFCLED
jgi:hypothetical protein